MERFKIACAVHWIEIERAMSGGFDNDWTSSNARGDPALGEPSGRIEIDLLGKLVFPLFPIFFFFFEKKIRAERSILKED